MSNHTQRDELERLGNTIDPELATILRGLAVAEKQVEEDGTSYRHMPDYFVARGKLVAYTQRLVLEAQLEELRRSKVNAGGLVEYYQIRQTDLQSQLDKLNGDRES